MGLLRETVLWLLGRRLRYRARGRSMLPTLRDGAHVLVRPLSASQALPQPERLVVFQHPGRELVVVKRVAQVGPHSIWVLSDNAPEGTDSRHFGWVNRERLIGEVTAYF